MSKWFAKSFYVRDAPVRETADEMRRRNADADKWQESQRKESKER